MSSRAPVRPIPDSAHPETLGGSGFAAEYDTERELRETRLSLSALISTNLILSDVGEHVPGMAKSHGVFISYRTP